MDIVGPFPKAVGNKRWLLVDTDYFTKWVKTEPLANILIRARSLFKDIKRSGYLMFFKVAISFGKRRVCSKALAR